MCERVGHLTETVIVSDTTKCRVVAAAKDSFRTVLESYYIPLLLKTTNDNLSFAQFVHFDEIIIIPFQGKNGSSTVLERMSRLPPATVLAELYGNATYLCRCGAICCGGTWVLIRSGGGAV